MIRMVRIKNEELNSALNLITSALNFKHKTKNSNNNWLKKLMLNISLIKLREKFLNLRGARKAVQVLRGECPQQDLVIIETEMLTNKLRLQRNNQIDILNQANCLLDKIVALKVYENRTQGLSTDNMIDRRGKVIRRPQLSENMFRVNVDKNGADKKNKINKNGLVFNLFQQDDQIKNVKKKEKRKFKPKKLLSALGAFKNLEEGLEKKRKKKKKVKNEDGNVDKDNSLEKKMKKRKKLAKPNIDEQKLRSKDMLDQVRQGVMMSPVKKNIKNNSIEQEMTDNEKTAHKTLNYMESDNRARRDRAKKATEDIKNIKQNQPDDFFNVEDYSQPGNFKQNNLDVNRYDKQREGSRKKR